MSSVKTTIKIPSGYSYETKQEIAARILSAIILNSKNGYDKNGNPFAEYTKQYAEIKGSSDVDLTLSGEMLDSMKVLKIGRDYIDIGYDGRTKQAGKAEGNILGSYGRTPNQSKARDFLGIPEDELDTILSSFEMDEETQGNQRFEDAVDRIGREMTPAQLERLRQEQFLRDNGLNNE